MAVAIDVTHRETSQPESATTLGTIVDLVRRITHADTTSVISFSQNDNTITWEAAAGFITPAAERPITQQLNNVLADRVLAADSVVIVQGIGRRDGYPADEFPIHALEGICDLAIIPLRSRGVQLGALIAGYRLSHEFTVEEKESLRGLADMAGLALDNARLVETLATAEKIWEQTFEAIGEGILAYDENGRILRCNARAAEMLDLKNEEVTDLTFEEAFARMFGGPAAAYHLADSRDLSSGFEVQTETGRRYLTSIASIRQPSENTIKVATWKDVTQLSEVQEQLSRSRRLGSVGQLAAGVAHEINNPLAAISACAEAVIRDVRKSDDTQKLASEHQWNYYLEEIVRQSQRCKEITRGLLDLTQQRQAKRSMTDLNGVARDCLKVAVHRPESARIEFKVALDEGIGQIATDPALVCQILDNLLSNAADAVGENDGRVTVRTARETDRALIEVADNGPGIPADLLPKIFDPFVSTKRAGKGYGLGLAICAALAEALGASLTVESKEGEGSRFRLWIPRRAADVENVSV
ncbi:MAG TPA: ATP-binding protein [Pyrinomonadaceae bacterium]|nr:ATP-binding protein [Pyrinomonadaceae bacterium]